MSHDELLPKTTATTVIVNPESAFPFPDSFPEDLSLSPTSASIPRMATFSFGVDKSAQDALKQFCNLLIFSLFSSSVLVVNAFRFHFEPKNGSKPED